MSSKKLAVSLLTLIMSTGPCISGAWANDKPQTFAGRVSDAMCGANHMMEGSAEDCTRACVRKGSKYALVVGEKVYTLDASDKATLDNLDQLANKNVKVTGTANGDTITVKSAAATK